MVPDSEEDKSPSSDNNTELVSGVLLRREVSKRLRAERWQPLTFEEDTSKCGQEIGGIKMACSPAVGDTTTIWEPLFLLTGTGYS